MNIFESIELDEGVEHHLHCVKEKAQELYDMMNHLQTNREMQLAKANLEQAVMWYVKGIALREKRAQEADEAIARIEEHIMTTQCSQMPE